jgi:hypothetical protein
LLDELKNRVVKIALQLGDPARNINESSALPNGIPARLVASRLSG